MPNNQEEIVRHLDDVRKIVESVINLSPIPNQGIEKLNVDFEGNARCRKVCITIGGKEYCWCIS